MRLYLLPLLLLASCSSTTVQPLLEPKIVEDIQYSSPAPKKGPIIVGVYSYTDMTGQRQGTGLSSAVTQGAENYLIDGLKDYSNGAWFRVLERKNIENIIKERQIIRSAMDEVNPESELPSMLYAGMLVEGGIVGYDANTLSGGDGVRVFGIGVSEKYTKHTVTVAIRAISVATSEVLASILVEKEILSITDNLTATKFFDLDRKVIEIESGTTTNEASNYAVRSAVNKAVHELVLEGLSNKLW